MSYLTCDHQFHRDFGGPRPTIVVLCGSTRFRDQFAEENRRLTLAGCIVLAPGVFGHAGDPAPTEAEKAALDELHFRKIDLADRVVVINPGGYVGDSTRREIDYAISCGKVISWLEGSEDTPEALGERLRPFVACKAPSPLEPNWFCKNRLDHSKGACWYVPVDQLPDSADDEGDDGPAEIRADEQPGLLMTDPAQVRIDELRDQRADEPITNRCAICGDTIDLIDGAWKHRPGLRSPHDPEPANLTAPRGAA